MVEIEKSAQAVAPLHLSTTDSPGCRIASPAQSSCHAATACPDGLHRSNRLCSGRTSSLESTPLLVGRLQGVNAIGSPMSGK